MGKELKWDEEGERFFETGVSKGAFYPIQGDGTYSKGYVWNGLSSVNENPSGADANPTYADNIKYLNLIGAEDFSGTIESYTEPEMFAECDGSKEIAPGVFAGQQNRKKFGFTYQTILGNDTAGNSYGYTLHLVYGANAAPSSKQYSTVNESPEPVALSWEFKTTPVAINTVVDGKTLKPTATLELRSDMVPAAKMKEIEDILYGTENIDPRLPLPDEVIQILSSNSSSSNVEPSESSES